ncbi:MAG TPA: hypothetical protein VKA70_13050 [Blastocatellia bacterium]|nr:hypothetical protein [Blastocatellia bacterium]
MRYTPRAARSTRALRLRFLFPFLALASLSCGKPGAPVPPVRLTERTNSLTAVQRGANVLLSWPGPVLVKDESDRAYIARVEIYRLVEQRDEEPVLDPDDFAELSEIVGDLERDEIEDQLESGRQLQFTDALDLSRAADIANTRLRYAIRYVNRRGQTAAFSNSVVIEPVPGIAKPPAAVSLAGQAQDAITIEWEPPGSDITETRPPTVIGYNVYRRAAKRESFNKPLNDEPITQTRFTDTNFKYQADYVYVVRALSQGRSGLIESADSPSLQVTPKDVYAPSAPDPVSVASANGVISLFWPTSPERDVVGYNVYRADSAAADEQGWVKLNAEPLSPVTFRDDRVNIGQRYFYRVTAVDRFGNESKPSAVVSETANP